MRLKKWAGIDPRTERRILTIAALARRRDRLLETPGLDLEGLRLLVADYEAAGLVCAATDLRRRLEHYQRTFGMM